ncbi:MAG: macro domain-containing protein [Ignavibacteriales bacterium]|nr:macro domain-containing protein [Ignavibacteriales bacterium]
MKIRIGPAVLSVVQGDIADQDVDAVVNAANNHLWMGAGVAGAIKRKGGDVIEDEAMALGPIEVGKAVLTSAGSLRARHVIHAAVMGQDLHTNAELIQKATTNCLKLADQQQLVSMAFPALGTGVGGFPLGDCAGIMVAEAMNFLPRAGFLREVRFVLFDSAGLEIFEQELKRRSAASP